MKAGTRGLKRDLIIELQTSALTPEKGEIIRYRAVIRWDEVDDYLCHLRGFYGTILKRSFYQNLFRHLYILQNLRLN